jgi:hypothetical protein
MYAEGVGSHKDFFADFNFDLRKWYSHAGPSCNWIYLLIYVDLPNLYYFFLTGKGVCLNVLGFF